MNILSSFMDFSSDYFLEINGFGLTWYATCILIGIIIAYILGVNEAKRFNISKNYILDGLLICVPLAIIGARLYYIIFALDEFIVPNDFMGTVLNMLGFNGSGFALAGLSIIGAVPVAIIFAIIYCRKRKLPTLAIFDLLAPGLLVGQICGRWGNFFNNEAHGGRISARTFEWLNNIIPNFIMKEMEGSKLSDFGSHPLVVKGAYYHPTFLYESLWNLVGLFFILIARRKMKKLRIGDTICFYLTWYGLGRALLIEPFRMDPLVIFGVRVNIVVPLIFAVVGVVFLVLKHTKYKAPYYIELQKEIKENKIDGLIFRIEDVLVGFNRLLKNSYYYTEYEIFGKNLYDDELDKLIEIKPEEYYKDKEEALVYFKKYFKENLSQLTINSRPKEFFKFLFTHDYGVVLLSKYDKEIIEYVVDLLKITTYVSLLNENGSITESNQLLRDYKHILVVTANKNDVIEAQKIANLICVPLYTKELSDFKLDVDYTIKTFDDLTKYVVD